MSEVGPRTGLVERWFTRGRKPNAPFKTQPFRFRFYVNMLEFGRRLKYMVSTYDVEIVGGGVVLAMLALASLCSACVTEVVKDEVEPVDLTGIAEAFCNANEAWPCGHVFMCDTPDENELGLVEVCKLDDTPIEAVELVYGSCMPTPRHVGLCWHCCGEGCTVGCNAYNGCFCPVSEPEPPMCDMNPTPPVHP